MEIIKPSFGLIFWMLIGFGILFFILAKYAWPIISKSIADREQKIEEQLAAAAQAREDMKNLKSEHQALLTLAKEERDTILADARKLRDKLYDEAKDKADEEAQQIIKDAKKAINFEKMKAMTEMKNEIANMSIEIAEKILRQELADKDKQEKLVDKWINEVNLN
ncbi:MAG TPA: F0F1 ATP synthase subunit B [Bacteroidales bacterium]|jgi:F-type H+-transporting ATPase subunit b|nr:F0F1 ATP synthase subunit B [Bacteroidales bacterium]HOF46320.1 F0F1 ATP synthase subunit B [Bacteroidales bacterium]HOS58183.1 F0F1 ATP synthase subunit B [Bacteroidales bacterium]HPY80572.1 F0F1 ATP synthase subunit B [Bacteroidales bacterium]HRR04321.1 F0F1 ATP synthase subunit B [Bacteroidales bacterium]